MLEKDQNIEAGYPDKNYNQQLPVNLESTSMINYNKILSGVQNYNNLNYIANKLIGIDCKWFRSVPQQRSKDVIFQEYTLSNVDSEPTCIKAVIPNGQIPDSKYNYDLNGLEYEVPLEINIDKRYWEETFGQGTAPQKNDIVYLIMPNKLYNVISSSLIRGFMEQETTWKCNLVKYKPQASVKESNTLKATLEQYIVSEESLFGQEIESNINKLTSTEQLSPFNGTVRDFGKYLDSTLKTVKEPLNIWGTIVSDYYYDLSTSNSNDAIIYYGDIDYIDNKTDRSLFAWFSLTESNNKKYDVISINPASRPDLSNKINFAIKLSNPNLIDASILNITRNELISLYADIIAIENNFYYCNINESVLEYLNNISSTWYNLSNYIATTDSPITIMHGIGSDDISGLNNQIINRRFHRLQYGNQVKVSVLEDNLEYDTWYGYVANLGNTWNKHNITIWEPISYYKQGNDKLKVFFEDEIDFEYNQTIIDRSIIHKSYSKITNIRVFNVTAEEEKQQEILLSMIDKNGDQILFADNALPIFKTPYIARTR